MVCEDIIPFYKARLMFGSDSTSMGAALYELLQ
jgi:hypothetical protein